MASAHILAADIGGTKIATAVITSEGEILRMSKASSVANSPPALIDRIATMLQDDLRQAGVNIAAVLGLGVGIAAVISADHRVVTWAPNLPGWKDVPLHDELATRLNLPVCIEYDGHTAVLGEWWLGAGRGYQNVVFVIVGTGIGGGMILNGQLYRGTSGLAGAAGWFVLDTQRVSDKYARRLGHWESLAAGPAIDRLAAERLRQSGEPSVLREQGPDPHDKLTTQMIFDAARGGDILAHGLVRQAGEILGVGIANIVSLVNPEIVILGGGVGIQADLLMDPIRQVVLHNAQPTSAQAVQILPAKLGAKAGLLGAAKAILLCQERCGEQ